MISTTDQLNRNLLLPDYPIRIISTVPSQTELLFDIGLKQEVVGITKFCIHPDVWFHSKTRIGGTKNLNIEKIRQLNPDLIIANKEENSEEQINELAKEFPIWISDIKNLDDSLKMISEISRIVNRKNEGEEFVDKIRIQFEKLSEYKPYSCVYLIWKNPMMTVGRDTFISEMLKYAGLKNIFDNKTRYPEIVNEELRRLKPEYIFLSSEPYPFKDPDVIEFRSLFPDSEIYIVDGEMFSWYGSRLLKVPAYFEKLRVKIESAL